MMPLVFDGANSAAGRGGVKAAQSAPAGLSLDPDATKARLQNQKQGSIGDCNTESPNSVAITKNENRSTLATTPTAVAV